MKNPCPITLQFILFFDHKEILPTRILVLVHYSFGYLDTLHKCLQGVPLVKQTPAQYRAVILAGPHKTGSTSIQSNLFSWSKAGSLGHNWTWVTPNMTCVHENSAACQNPPWLLLPSQIPKAWNCVGTSFQKTVFQKIPYLCSKLITCYSGALKETVFAKKNVVFGYEQLANDVVRFKEKGGDELMHYIQKLVDILPSTFYTKDDITVIITYRAPRIDQLTSSWKHRRDINRVYHGTALTFRSFLSSRFIGLGELYAWDSLRAATVIAQEFGFKVVVLDTSGIQLMGYDISNVVACEILGAPCNRQSKTLELGGNLSMPIKLNVREDEKKLNDLTVNEKMAIELIMQKLDCNSARLIFEHPRILVIYPYLLNQTRHACSANHTYYTHEEAAQDIKSAVTFEAQTLK
jgi:hypothetical protein